MRSVLAKKNLSKIGGFAIIFVACYSSGSTLSESPPKSIRLLYFIFFIYYKINFWILRFIYENRRRRNNFFRNYYCQNL